MKTAFILLALVGCAAQAQPAPPGKIAQFHRFEVSPKTTLTLTFDSPKCRRSDIKIRSFESQASYPSTESGALAAVRIIHLYVEIPSCSKPDQTPSPELTYVLTPAKKLMTHVYLTTEEPVFLARVQQ